MEDKYRKILAEVVFFGITPALAATINSAAALSMAVGIIFIMVLSTIVMRLMRKLVTEENKVFVTLVVTALFASIFQMVTEAYAMEAYKEIGIYIALCSINMMVFGAAYGGAGYEEKNIVGRVVLFSIVFGIVVFAVGSLREILGVGTWGRLVLFSSKAQIFQKAPGAYMTGAVATAVVAFIVKKSTKKKEAK